ncbi:MAG: CotH kinase family protein [Salibacteraceae bacterium]
MKHLLSIFASLLALSISAQTFYDLNTVQKIEITFSQSNWDQLLDNAKATTEDYIMAQSVTINGEVFDSVGVKYKGNSTYRANQTKNPFHIELDTYKDHIYENYTDIKLSNVANDPSFVREVLSYQILRQYMDAPLSNYANVYVNGTLIGLYSNSEAITKKFLSSRFNSKKNTFIKCNPIDGAGPSSTDLPNLEYLGTDSSNYNKAYELKSDYGWSHLINLCDTLKNQIGNIEDVLDVDRALWMLAFNNVLVNLDSYSGGFAQNYYLYKSDYNQFLPVVWDLNESFGRFAMTGSGNLNGTTQKQQMSHLLHENDADYPLISQLLSNPMYKRMYIAHMKTMLLENFDNGSYYTTGQSLQTTIDSDVQNDQNKFFTYANFTSNLTSDINSGGGPGGGSTPGVKSLMDGRSSYLLSQSDFQKTAPTISNITLSNSNPSIGDKVFVTSDVSTATNVYIGYRYDSNSPFVRTLMFDDGNHGDGASGDGKYGFEVTVSSSTVEYYLYAENSDAGIFSPVRAEYEYHLINTTGSLVINEFGASNSSVVKNDQGGYSDWIEIYNNSSSAISLNGYYLSDDLSDTMTYKFPDVSLNAGEFLMIWASGDSTLSEYHADFKLSASGEEVVLFYDNGNDIQMIDYVSFSSQTTDYSYGRVTDAATDWQVFKIPTPNATNIDRWTSVNENELTTEFKVYPNPYNGQINIENPNSEVAQLKIFDLKGQLLHSSQLAASENFTWKEMEQAKGMRIILIETATTQKVYKVISQ